jgi:hypothetical protein
MATRCYAFNHFTVSKKPEENAQQLLASLSNRELTFDVIAHSRGGLVLRNLVERGNALGPAGNRFKLRHAVLVASPNDGTPLATPERWQNTIGWFANLLEVFPDNPLTFAAGFVADAVVWIAQRAGGSLPGIASMDSGGEMIAELQGPPGPPPSGYSALAANFLPGDELLARMLDVGIDAFFGSANDLVVPSEGGWLIDPAAGGPAIPPDRIGCFGPGGNFPSNLPSVHHLNFFGRTETAGFLARALAGQPHGLPPIDPASPLPDSRLRRRTSAAPALEQAQPVVRTPPALPVEPKAPSVMPALSPVYSDALQLTLIAPRSDAGKPGEYQLLVSYGGARIIEPYDARGGEAGQRWFKIIAMHERMKKYVDGQLGFKTPTDDELIDYGKLLFETLFPRESRRLYDVVHFIGHGAFDTTEQQGYLLFEDDKGAVFNVSARTACEILCQRGIRLIFLNACETGRGDTRGSAARNADFNRGIAPALVANGLPAVVANQFSVRDQAATEFSQHFYWALAQGSSFGSAAREARIAVNYSTTRDTIDWAVPVVYARDPESRLCMPRELTLDMVRTPLVAASARRATAGHERRVAVWDMNNMFPDLEATVQQMNAAQTRFGFEVVDISVPMGSWQRYKDEGLQLHANIAAGGLKNKRQELSVDFIFCITDKPIMYEDGEQLYWNYYCWWSDRGKENIVIFSADYAGLPTHGLGANRAIANALVQGLTGILADTGTHARGPKTCPLYWNEELDLTLVVGTQAFDAKCEKLLKKKIPNDLPALKALLTAFN